MKLGKTAMEKLQAEVTGRLFPGDELLVVGAVALQGTVIAAEKRQALLKKYFSEGFLRNTRTLWRDYGTGEAASGGPFWKMAEEAGAGALYAMGEGGFLAALWKMAEASGVGLRVDLRKVPIRQETIEICERLGMNPYCLLSGGALLVGIRGGEALAQECRRSGIPAEIIGQVNEENDRLLYSGENIRYLDRPAEDEIKGVVEEWQN